jgi:hypothetical protein
MPTKIKSYKWVKFPPEVLQKALDSLKSSLAEDQVKADYRIQVGSESWRYDYGEETTFFDDYQSNFRLAVFKPIFDRGHLQVVAKWHASPPFSEVAVRLPEKSQIGSVFKIFEDSVSNLEPPWKSQVKIFIGHGGSPQWEALRDYLVKKQQLKVEAYEIGARAGLTTKEILEEMLKKSSFALLVMTGEDKDAEGKLHARENVIHEVGLFQGKLGFRRAIVLLEKGTEEFSNIKGIEQIRFKKGLIKEIFGKVIEAIEREFCS